MRLPEFKLERYFDRFEFHVPYLLCCSDCETFSIREILEMQGTETAALFLEQRLGYTEARGNPGLRETVAGLYGSIGPEEVLVFSGAEEAIFIFANAVLSPGDHVIVQSPCYQSLTEVARAVGCEVTEWTLVETKTGWTADLDLLADSLRPNTRAVIVNSPHNPTGYLFKPDEMRAIVGLARERGILLFSDEVYRGLEYEDNDRLAAACDVYENAVSLGVMSKAYGLAGLRIGWIATHNSDVYEKMAAFKDYTTICSSAPSEFLAAAALTEGERLVKRNLGIIKENLGLLDEFFAQHGELFSWRRPKAGPIAFPRINYSGGAENFCAGLVESKGVLLLPSTCYDYGDVHVRIGFGRRDMRCGLQKLGEYAAENGKLRSF